METKGHTPGPWTIGYGGQDADNYAVIISPHSTRAICNIEPLDYTQANARLIAAAPELLGALECLVVAFESGVQTSTFIECAEYGENSCLGAARAAIRKATEG